MYGGNSLFHFLVIKLKRVPGLLTNEAQQGVHRAGFARWFAKWSLRRCMMAAFAL
jgi:hypothetical protein